MQQRLRSGPSRFIQGENIGNGRRGQRPSSGVGRFWAPAFTAHAPRQTELVASRAPAHGERHERAEPVFLRPPALGALWDSGGGSRASEALRWTAGPGRPSRFGRH